MHYYRRGQQSSERKSPGDNVFTLEFITRYHIRVYVSTSTSLRATPSTIYSFFFTPSVEFTGNHILTARWLIINWNLNNKLPEEYITGRRLTRRFFSARLYRLTLCVSESLLPILSLFTLSYFSPSPKLATDIVATSSPPPRRHSIFHYLFNRVQRYSLGGPIVTSSSRKTTWRLHVQYSTADALLLIQHDSTCFGARNNKYRCWQRKNVGKCPAVSRTLSSYIYILEKTQQKIKPAIHHTSAAIFPYFQQGRRVY